MVIMEHQKAILRLRPTQAVCGIQMTFRIWVVILTTTFFSNHLFGQSISIEDADFEKYLEKKAIPIVKGKILNLTPAELSDLKINYTLVTPFANFQETRSIALNGDGSFELKLDHAFPFQQIWLAVGEIFYAGIYANTDLFVEFDALTLKSQTDAAFYCPGVKYLGTDGDLNRYINNRTLYQRETQVKVNSAATMMAYQHLPYPQFLKKYDSLFSILRQIDQNFIKSQPLEYSWMIVNDRDSEYYSNLYVYHFGRPMPAELFEKINKHKPQLISNDGMLFYQYSVLYLQMLPRKNKSSNLKERTLTTIRKIDSLYSPPKSDMLKLKLASEDPIEDKEISQLILQHTQTQWCKRAAKDQYEKAVDKVDLINKTLSEAKNLTSPGKLGEPLTELTLGARLYKVDTLTANRLLSNLKNSFPNRALFIDLWATWCGPCIAEFSHSNKLQESTNDLPVEFIYLCSSEGSTIDKWKTKVAEFGLKGTHIFVEKNIMHQFLEMFSLSGFPSYILINEKGEYEPSDKLRPSNLDREKLKELIK